MYYAALDLIEEFKYDFCGIKGQRELTEHFATADVAEAFLNDPVRTGRCARSRRSSARRRPIRTRRSRCRSSSTSRARRCCLPTSATTTRISGVWDLCNSGEHATYFAGRSLDPAVNLGRTEFRPQGFYFPAGGAAVYHIAAPGRVTLARLTRHDGRYVMNIVPAEFVDFGDQQRRDRRDQPGQLATCVCPVRLQCRDVHRAFPLQSHPRRVRALGRRARAALRRARHPVPRSPLRPERTDHARVLHRPRLRD